MCSTIFANKYPLHLKPKIFCRCLITKKRAYGFERLDQTGEFEPRAPERRILLERLDENVDRLVHLTQFAQYDAITRSYNAKVKMIFVGVVGVGTYYCVVVFYT